MKELKNKFSSLPELNKIWCGKKPLFHTTD
jgi:hypothetical protein